MHFWEWTLTFQQYKVNWINYTNGTRGMRLAKTRTGSNQKYVTLSVAKLVRREGQSGGVVGKVSLKYVVRLSPIDSIHNLQVFAKRLGHSNIVYCFTGNFLSYRHVHECYLLYIFVN